MHHARDGVEFSVADPDLYLRLRLDVAHPDGALSLGNKVAVPAMLGEPDLDFPRLTGDAASGGQVEVHGTRSDYQHISGQSSWIKNRCTGTDPPSVWISTKNSPMPGIDTS